MESLTLLGFGPTGWGDEIAWGVVVTASLALATLPIGLVFGFLLALAKQTEDKLLKLSADIYTTIFRGLPELLTLFIVYFGVNNALQSFSRATGLPDIALSSFVSGMVALGFVFSAFASEVFLSAFRAIPRGQYEGSSALGLSRYQTMILVVLPQLIRIALPGLGNLWMNLLKDTALVSVIGLTDILRQSQIAARVTREPFLFFGTAIVIYLVLTLLSSVAIGGIDRWTKRGEMAK
ncbi:amino acid ABC transporter membrane protein 1, PAAT family [Fulvimarina manganoxydans]|uniref:Amino acid ABC transporter membrane protein 1, PAAT family n=1 Tax=Fulvimarina manganoxydans TaxID=937218 RepID=A0A1W2CD66_9HYPH|nr:ABC transporter permease [Fulvimarina manganoxydans]MEE2951604.1 ABC transporter permease [Pseudomonadota bacterium]SMC83099.1 amino acid ABC transporter membrane protein 1, PAAT family [Fulvimarina manganoxydans]